MKRLVNNKKEIDPTRASHYVECRHLYLQVIGELPPGRENDAVDVENPQAEQLDGEYWNN